MSATLTAADAAHLLRRTAFGASAAEIQSYVGLTRAQAIARVLPPSVPAAPSPPFDLSRTDDWKTQDITIDWWIERMRTSAHPIVERIALLWHDHFACGRDKVENMDEMWKQHVLFRTVGLGDFAELVRQVSVGGAMLRYLDNETNRAGEVQENFGRELMELFTCGVGNYTEADVVAMARAWTGHNTVGWNGSRHDLTYRFRSEHHDHGSKTLFDITRNWDGPETIDELCRGAKAVPTSRRVAWRFYRAFIGPNPPPGSIDSLAASFRAADLDVLALVRAVLLHDDFWSPANRRTLLKSPVEYVADLFRLTDTALDTGVVRWLMEPMGQHLFTPPDVSGWGVNEYWMSTATMWGRADFCQHVRYTLGDASFLTEVEDRSLPADVAARRGFEAFGIIDPSDRSVADVARLITDLRPNLWWTVRRNVFTFIATSEEFQVR